MRKRIGSSRLLRGATVVGISLSLTIVAATPSHAVEITDIPSLPASYQPAVTVVGAVGTAVAGIAVAGTILAAGTAAIAFTASFITGGEIASRIEFGAPSTELPDTAVQWGVAPKYVPGQIAYSIKWPELHPNGDDEWKYRIKHYIDGQTINTVGSPYSTSFPGSTQSLTFGSETATPIVGVAIQVQVKNVAGDPLWLTVLSTAVEGVPEDKKITDAVIQEVLPEAPPFGCGYNIVNSAKCKGSTSGSDIITKCQNNPNLVITPGPALTGGVVNAPVGAGCAPGDVVEESGIRITQDIDGQKIPIGTPKYEICSGTSVICQPGVVASGKNPYEALDPSNPDRECIAGTVDCHVQIKKTTSTGTVDCAVSTSCSDFKTALTNVASGTSTWAEQGYSCTFNGRQLSMNQCLGTEHITVKNWADQNTTTPGTGTGTGQASECVPSGTQLLNPVSYVSMTTCLAQWAFVPKTPIGVRISAVNAAFSSTPLGKIRTMLGDFAETFDGLQVQPTEANCQGPGIAIPTHLAGPEHEDVIAYPFNACDGIVKTLTDHARPIATGTVYVTGLLTAFNILLGAFGMSLRLPNQGGEKI